MLISKLKIRAYDRSLVHNLEMQLRYIVNLTVIVELVLEWGTLGVIRQIRFLHRTPQYKIHEFTRLLIKHVEIDVSYRILFGNTYTLFENQQTISFGPIRILEFTNWQTLITNSVLINSNNSFRLVRRGMSNVNSISISGR